MAIFAKTRAEIYGEIALEILETTNITRMSPGGKMRALIQAVSKKQAFLNDEFDVNFIQSFLVDATGRFLDFLGAMMGVERLVPESSKVDVADKIIKFYVSSGTFSDINDGSGFSVPAGTVISTRPDGKGIVYTTTYATLIPAADSEAFVAASARETGTSYQAAAKQLVHHSFTGYTQSSLSTLLVTNTSEITTGRDIESDTNYRYRIARQVTAAEAANLSSIRIAVLSVPGVSDLTPLPYFSGIGTADLLIKATSPHVSNSLIAVVQESVAKKTGFGNVMHIRGPIELGMTIKCSVVFRSNLTDDEKTSILEAAEYSLSYYIDNLDHGEEFILNEAVERVMSVSEEIKDIGEPGAPFDDIKVWVPSSMGDNPSQNTPVQNYEPESDEKLLVRIGEDTKPILVIEKI